MEKMQAEAPFESNKRKMGSFSSSASSTESDDNDYNLPLKRSRESSTDSDEDHFHAIMLECARKGNDNLQSLVSKTDIVSSAGIGDQVNSDDSLGDIKEALNRLPPKKVFPLIVVAYYNNNKKYDKVMEVTGVKVVILQFIPSATMYFTSFDAKLTAKDGKGTPELTNCCSVLFRDLYSDGPEVFSFKLGSLEDEDFKNWFQSRPRRHVLYKASEVEAAHPTEETDSDNEEEDVHTDKGHEDEDSDNGDEVVDSDSGDEDVNTDGGDENVDSESEDEDVDTDSGDEDVDSVSGDEDVDTDGGDEDVDSDGGDEDIHSDSADEDADTDGGNGDVDHKAGVGVINKEEHAQDRRTKCTSCRVISVKGVRVLKMAEEAVAYYNNEDTPGLRISLVTGEVKDCFTRSRDVAVCENSLYGVTEPYHLNFDASLMDKDGKETEHTTCQAVISKQGFGGIKEWFFRISSQKVIEVDLSSPSPGKETNIWCKDGHCVCAFPYWNEMEEKKDLLKCVSPEWYPSSKDGWEVVDKKNDA